jgi:hypothetical protein
MEVKATNALAHIARYTIRDEERARFISRHIRISLRKYSVRQFSTSNLYDSPLLTILDTPRQFVYSLNINQAQPVQQ